MPLRADGHGGIGKAVDCLSGDEQVHEIAMYPVKGYQTRYTLA